MEGFKGLVKRSDKLAFYGVKGEGGGVVYHRMTKFTQMSTSKNPKEYARQYIDENFEQSDVVGYSPAMSYGFDQYKGSPVHDDIVAIHDNELLGDGAVRSVILVDLTSEGTTPGTFAARKRDFAVIPDGEGDSTDAYTYSGNLKVKSGITVGTATSDDGWDTCTFAEMV